MRSKIDLELLHSNLCNALDKDKIKLFHLNSIGNFIKYFDKLDEKYKAEISDKILNYLNIIELKKWENISTRDSLFLFSEYVNPIGMIYQQELGFGLEAITWMRVVDIILIVLGCWIINTFWLLLIIFPIMFWYGRLIYLRSREGKIYKYRY